MRRSVKFGPLISHMSREFHTLGSLEQIPSLGRSVVAVPKLELCAAAGDVEAAAGLRILKEALLSPTPLLRPRPVTIPKLNPGAIGAPAAGDVHTFVENA